MDFKKALAILGLALMVGCTALTPSSPAIPTLPLPPNTPNLECGDWLKVEGQREDEVIISMTPSSPPIEVEGLFYGLSPSSPIPVIQIQYPHSIKISHLFPSEWKFKLVRVWAGAGQDCAEVNFTIPLEMR